MAIVLRVEDPYARFFVPLQQAFTNAVTAGLENYFALQRWKEQQDYLAQQKEREKAKLMELLSGLDFSITPDVVQAVEPPTFKVPEVGLFQDREKRAPWQSLFNAPVKPKEEPPPQPTTFISVPKSPSELYAGLIEKNKPVIAGALAYGINLFPYVREMAENVQREAQATATEERINRYVSAAVKRNPFASDETVEYYKNLMALDTKAGIKAIQDDLNHAKMAMSLSKKLKADAQDLYHALRGGLKSDDVIKLYNQGYQVKNLGGAIVLVDSLGNVVLDDEGKPKVVGFTPEHELAQKKYALDKWYKEQQVAIDRARLALERQRVASSAGKDARAEDFKVLNELRQAMGQILKKYKVPTPIDPTQAINVLEQMQPEDRETYLRLYSAYQERLNRLITPQVKPQQQQQPVQQQRPHQQKQNPFKTFLGK